MMLVNYFLFIESKKRIPSVLHMTILTIRMATATAAAATAAATAAKHLLTVVVAEMYVSTAVSVIYAVVVNA